MYLADFGLACAVAPTRACPLHRAVLTQKCVSRQQPPDVALMPDGQASFLTHFDAPMRRFSY